MAIHQVKVVLLAKWVKMGKFTAIPRSLYIKRFFVSFSWVRVEWYTGATNSYRMGKEGQYDLRLADSALNIVSPDTETEKDELCCEAQLNGESHPTKLLRYACTNLLQIISVGIGLHSERMEKNAVRGMSSMFRAILNPKSTLANICGLDNWTTLGFLKAIAGKNIENSFSILL